MEEEADSPRRGRRLITLLAVAGALAAVPAGVALAGGSDGSGPASGAEGQSGATTIQQEAQPDAERPDRGDCPEKDGQGGRQGSSEQDTSELDTTQLSPAEA